MRAHRLEQPVKRAPMKTGRRRDLDQTQVGSLRAEAFEYPDYAIKHLTRIDSVWFQYMKLKFNV
jgi:hypothetical protein